MLAGDKCQLENSLYQQQSGPWAQIDIDISASNMNLGLVYFYVQKWKFLGFKLWLFLQNKEADMPPLHIFE